MKWNILNKLKAESKELKVEEIVKLLLNNRGLKTKKQVDEFLSPTNPEKFSAKDLGIDKGEILKAIKRIKKAIKNNESIIVYGDYDADGICATAILWEILYKLTPNVLPYIPERVSEGYGMNCDSISKLKSSAFAKASADKQNPQLKLIITVDHGITAADKIKYAKELGIDVIVCDHHQLPKEKPKVSAMVHTDKICAAAIVWFLAGKIQREDYLDLVAIATIADLEPLVGVNRSFVKHGLKALNETKRCGLLAILEEAGIKEGEIGTYEVGYIIAPRLNAMGRMEHALESLRLLCTKDEVKAKNLADKLGLTNRERQALTEETVKQAKLLVAGIEGGLPKFLVVDSDQYKEGIIGLVAGKLVEEYYRPAIVVAKGEVYSKASARSINGFNIIEAIRAQSDLLVDAGGHPMAAGFTIETIKLEILKERLSRLAETQITSALLEKTLKIDLELPLSAITMELWKEIQRMAPFGLGNPEPVFASKVVVKDLRTVGSEGKHLKLTLGEQQSPVPDGTGQRCKALYQTVRGKEAKPCTRRYGAKFQKISAVGFRMGNLAASLKFDQSLEVAYNVSLNKWNGNQEIELKLKDIKWPS